MASTKTWAIWLVVIITLAVAGAQILFKQGAELLPRTLNPFLFIFGMLTDVPFMLGILLYAIAWIFLMIALRNGEVTVLTPVLATNYLWVTLIGLFVLGETVGLLNWIGVISIVVGIALTVHGRNEQHHVQTESTTTSGVE